jgi:AcrR family transcriptional regulator
MPAKASRRPTRAAPVVPAGGPAEAAGDPRERIVAAARRHFFQFGFARCTMDDLAVELGMSKKTLYQHFRSKEALVDELITRKSKAMITGFEQILSLPRLSFADRTARFHHHALTHLREIHVAFLRDLQRFAPKTYQRVEAVRAMNVPRMWQRLLQLGIEAGAVRADVDVSFAAHLVLLTMQNLLLPENLERLNVQPHEAMGRFFNLLFTGLLTDAGCADYENHRASFIRPNAGR